jgi:Proton-conducting membrane transporter
MVFVATGHSALATFAFAAALYHMINHSLYKTLLFFGVGAVEAQAGTRDMDRLGGLIKWMPLTALGFLVGTLSIAALPPFNGFVSEWLTLQVMLRSAELSSTGADRVRPVRRGARANGGAGGDLLREGVRDELSGNAPARRGAAGDRSRPAHARVHGHSCGAVPRVRRTADVRDPNARPGIDAAGGSQRGRRPGAAVLCLGSGARHVTGRICRRVPRSRRAGGAGHPAWTRTGGAAPRRGGKSGGVRHVHFLHAGGADGFAASDLRDHSLVADAEPPANAARALGRRGAAVAAGDDLAEHFRMAIRRERSVVHIMDRFAAGPAKNAAMGLARGLAAMHHGRINAYVAYVLLALLLALAVGLL